MILEVRMRILRKFVLALIALTVGCARIEATWSVCVMAVLVTAIHAAMPWHWSESWTLPSQSFQDLRLTQAPAKMANDGAPAAISTAMTAYQQLTL
jgi:hypothetical protein